MNIAATTVPDTRFSRYRSVRKAARGDVETVPIPAVPPIPEVLAASVNRAPSRYRKTTAPLEHRSLPPLHTVRPIGSQVLESLSSPKSTATAESSSVASLEHGPDRALPAVTSPLTQHSSSRTVAGTRQAGPTHHVPRYATRRSREESATPPLQDTREERRSTEAAREEARLILEGEYDKLQQFRDQQRQKSKEQRNCNAVKSPQQEPAEVRPSGSRVEVIRGRHSQNGADDSAPSMNRGRAVGGYASVPATDHIGQAPSTSFRPVQVPQTDAPKLSYKVVSKNATSSSIQYHDQPKLNGPLRKQSSVDIRQKAALPAHVQQAKLGDGPPKTATNSSAPPVIFDAPVSAVNAGERRVEVRCEKSTITLPVTPTTTVRDVLNSASVIMSQSIDPRTSVLIENFVHLGLERPLRRYERVRDVMNSWDSDTQNHLNILSEGECAAAGLEQESAPGAPPSKTVLQLYHSRKPGRWDKRWMTLKSDGQVTYASKNNEVDAVNAFHLSDFDIYMPTKQHLRRLRPPKKICFAIKSQQRSIVFESTENFVHVFCTNDKETAYRWYNSIQAWRSYYLVHVLGEGLGNRNIPTNALEAVAVSIEPRSSASHDRDTIPYQLGTFETLLDISADEFRYSLHASSPATAHTRQGSLAIGVKSPQSTTTSDQYRHKASTRRSASIHRSSELTHSRQRSLVSGTRTRPIEQDIPPPPTTRSAIQPPPTNEAAFTGTGLLAAAFDPVKPQDEPANLYNDASQGFTGKGLLSRTMSRRTQPRTHTLTSTEPNTLVNLHDDPSAFTGAGLLAQQQQQQHLSPKPSVTLFTSPPTQTDQAFTGTGLLRTLTTKKSLTRTDPRAPGHALLDLSAQSTFQTGSLLRQIEDVGCVQGPVVDRSRGVEVVAKVGEGY